MFGSSPSEDLFVYLRCRIKQVKFMKKEIKRNTLVCVLDESTTANSLSNDLFFAMKRVHMENPKLNCADVHITTEARDGQTYLYAEWTSEENNYDFILNNN